MMFQFCTLHAFWILEILGVGTASALEFCLAIWAPDVSKFVTDLVFYGKSSSLKRSRFHKLIEVPKRYFTHFYVVGVALSTVILTAVIMQYEKKSMYSSRALPLLRRLSYPQKSATVDEASIELVVTLWWFHTVRRLLESAFLSVYSDTTMNALHYLIGIAHYVLVPVSLLAQAPGFISKGSKWEGRERVYKQLDDAAAVSQLTYVQLFAVLLYVFCSFHQHKIFCKFAMLRKNYLGNVTNYAHAIPSDGWFNLVSCPHFLFEVGLYLSMLLVLGYEHSLAILIFVFVTVNQTLAALITHNWYLKRFIKYPANRKAIFPYIL